MHVLAVIGKVVDTSEIDGADNIVSIDVVCGKAGRWKAVVRKDEVKLGDVVRVYLQDAILPDREEFEFMKGRKMRVRICKFKGAYSECLVMPLRDGETEMWQVGDDVTEYEGVVKYEKQLPPGMTGDSAGSFPGFINRTDEVNFQSKEDLVEALKGKPYYITVKYDGTSGTAYLLGTETGEIEYGVCSRNLRKKEGNNIYWNMAAKYELLKKLGLCKWGNPELDGGGIALQYEIVGPGIQKNPLGLSELEIRIFDGWLIGERRYLDYTELRQFCIEFDLPMAEVVETGDSFNYNADELRELAVGKYDNGKQREGIVIRPLRNMRLGWDRVSFKVINPNYKE